MLAEELKLEVPEPVHTMLADKESREDAVAKYKKCKEMETVICPPTCTGINIFQQRCSYCSVWLQLRRREGGEYKLAYLVTHTTTNNNYYYRSNN